jgi:SagB-type dehydrogenase family enzyme
MPASRFAFTVVATGALAVGCVAQQGGAGSSAPAATAVALPSPLTQGPVSLEEALLGRRSIREFADRSLTSAEIGQLLWAAQGVTDSRGYRTAPSAGALYPLEVFAVTADGVHRYLPADHALESVGGGDARPALRAAAWDQSAVGQAPLVIVIAADPGRTEAKYAPDRAERYVHLEAGHAAQNVLLQAVALGLGAVPVGAFDDSDVAEAVGLPPTTVPLYLLAIGHPR